MIKKKGEIVMGIIKGIGKVLGTTVLGATGVASSVLKGVFDTAGVELGSEIFGAAQEASFNGIRCMWDGEEAQERIEHAQNDAYRLEEGSRRAMADTAYRMAKIAKQNGDMEKYETYMAKYEEYK